MEKLKRNKKYHFLQILFFIVYFADALFYSYTSLFLSSLGYEEGLIGGIASITTITYLIVNPIWNVFARDSKRVRWMLACIGLFAGLFVIIYSKMSTTEMIMLLTALLASVMAPFYTLLDGQTVQFCKQNDKQYSNVRVLGSISYIFGTAFGGILIETIGFTNVFFIAGSIFLLVGMLLFFFRMDPVEEHAQKKRDFRAILKNKWFFFYLITYLFVISLNALGDNFVSLLFCKIKGVSTTNYGFISAGIIAAEVFTLLILGLFFRKTKEIYLFLFAGVVYFLRSLIISFVDLPVEVLIPAAMLRGVGWGTVLFVHMKYLIKLVGIENVTTAALFIVSFQSLFQFVGSNILGNLIENMGYPIAYRSIGIISIVFCLAFVASRCISEYKNRKKLELQL